MFGGMGGITIAIGTKAYKKQHSNCSVSMVTSYTTANLRDTLCLRKKKEVLFNPAVKTQICCNSCTFLL